MPTRVLHGILGQWSEVSLRFPFVTLLLCGLAGAASGESALQGRVVERIEVHIGLSQIPAPYNRTSGACRVVLVWTRG
jgi:hypothetical protein